jgi:cobalt/nickel transport system permease protein
MSFAHLDRYAGRSSWLATKTTPDQRLIIALAAAFAAGLMPPGARWALLALALLVALGVRASRLPSRALLRRVGPTVPFFLLPALTLPFAVPGRPILELGPLTASEEGLARAAAVIARAGLAVSAVAIVVSTTRAADLLAAMERLPLPRLLRDSMTMGYRYVYLLNDEAERTGRALRSRAGRAPARLLWQARAAALAHLVVRAHDRTARIHAAMLSRGYRGGLPVLGSTSGSAGWTGAILALLTAIWLLGWVEQMS